MPRRVSDHDCPTCGQPWPLRKPSERIECSKCGKSMKARGFPAHFAACPHPITLEKLWAAGDVDTSTLDACWLWSAKPEDKYPTYAGKRVIRWILELRHGEDMKGWITRHACDNPYCVNPAHLLRGTTAQNNADTYERNRIDFAARGRSISLGLKQAHQDDPTLREAIAARTREQMKTQERRECRYACGRVLVVGAPLVQHERKCGSESTHPLVGSKQSPEHVAKRLASRKERHGY